MSQFFRLCLVTMLMIYTFGCFALDNKSVSNTKIQLKQIETQIHSLKQILASAHDKRGALNQELANTEKKMGAGIRKMHGIQNRMKANQLKISSLQQHINELNQQLSAQQQLLAQHIRVRYKIGEYQPIKWLINQDDPYRITRLLTFHQYLVRSRQKIIDEIDTTKKNLTINESTLKNELAEQAILQERLHSNQVKLEQSKHYHTEVIQSLSSDIQSKEHKLSEFEQNKKNLSQLLRTLASQSITYTKLPFTRMRHKLPKPVKTGQYSPQKINQGITFFAEEGAPVHAVYPGKIVFSDWLNGYGLLLIIDHGQGFMTLYAHNQSLFKHKGSTVLQGEQIASVGHSGGIKQNGLYFEVRKGGKAIPALEWLS